MRLKLAIAVVLLILGSVSLAYFQLVVLKMLPFDNKSEFQIIVDMPLGTPLEETARVLREIGSELAQEPDVVNYQAYAGTASPINFNGLVRQYYLRAVPEKGDIQVNLADKQQRTPQEPRNRLAPCATASRRSARKNGGVAKVVEVPPGPPVMSPIVAEIYGPDIQGPDGVGKEVRRLSRRRRTLLRSTTISRPILASSCCTCCRARQRCSAWRRATSSRWSAWAWPGRM
jgi:multidrug efflux pump subunit AcrB